MQVISIFEIVDQRAASRHPKPCPDIGYPILHDGPSTPLYIKCICCLQCCCPRGLGLGLGLAKMACLHHCPFITLSSNGSRSFVCVSLLSPITMAKVSVYLLLIFFFITPVVMSVRLAREVTSWYVQLWSLLAIGRGHSRATLRSEPTTR